MLENVHSVTVMVRPRTNDPLGVSDDPVTVSDPQKERELVAELSRRLDYIKYSYLLGERTDASAKQFNVSLARLKAGGEGRARRGAKLARVHPWIETVISHHARRIAAERAGMSYAPVEGEDIKRAAKIAAEQLKPTSHRPIAANLRHHVRGLMAVLQEFSGKPVLVGKTRNSVDDPHFKPGVSEIVPMFFRDIDPSVTETQLVNIVLQARREYAGKKLKFADFFPGYGATMRDDGTLLLGSGRQIASVVPNVPTYYP